MANLLLVSALQRHDPNSSDYDPFDETQHGYGGDCDCWFCEQDHFNRCLNHEDI